MNARSPVYRLVITALAIALVAVGTMVIQIPTPTTQGYINFGDAIIFVTGIVFGPLIGLLSGGIGSALADLLSGYAHYAPWTLVVKGLEGLIVGLIAHRAFRDQLKLGIPVVGMIVAGAWMVAGYFLTAAILYGSAAAITSIADNVVQAGGSMALAAPLLVPIWSALRRNKR